MKIIQLLHDKEVIVDDEDYDWLIKRNWSLDKAGYPTNCKYIGKINGKTINETIRMHRLIVQTPKGFSTDHINGNKLDNRKCNLRVCTSSENHMNQRKTRGISKYKGVVLFKKRKYKKWCARIKINSKTKHLGYFYTEEEAATAYNNSAISLFGEFAKLNDIKL